MEIFRVSFIGHRHIDNFIQIETLLREKIIELLDQHEFVEFYVGKNGEFDDIVASTIKGVQKDFGKSNNSLILVLPYYVANVKYYENFYDEVLIPIRSHFKSAIEKRNKWLIENSEILICYINHEYGNAYKCLKYAKKHEKDTYNLYVKLLEKQ